MITTPSNFFENHHTKETILTWAINTLLKLNYNLRSNQPTVVKNTPFSYVAYFETEAELVWIKTTPNLISHEPQIIELLRKDFHAPVPLIISINPIHHIFLMKDHGVSLREYLRKKFDIALICKAIEEFTELQINVSKNTQELINLGVPNWSLSKLPMLYNKFISESKYFLLRDGLTIEEYHRLLNLNSTIMKLTDLLSTYSIKETLVQPDFNDNNILIDKIENKLTFIDLGEISISHPFFSLINMLYQLKKHHGLKEGNPQYQKIKKSCFSRYEKFEPYERLLEAFEIARSLWLVYGAIAYERLMQACGPERIISYQPGKLASTLRDLLTILK